MNSYYVSPGRNCKKKKRYSWILPLKKTVHGPAWQTLVSLLCGLTGTLTASQDSANFVFPLLTPTTQRLSACMWLKQTYQEGCAVCSRAHPRKKLFDHEDTPQTANPSSQIRISHENLTHGLGLRLSIFFDWQMKFLRKTSVIQNHLILEPYQTNMRKSVWVCKSVVCVCMVCVCVCVRHTELELSAQYSSQLMKALHSLLILRENIVVIHFVSGLLKTGITGETPELFLISLYQNSFWKDKIFPPLSPWPQINPWTIPEREREKGEMRFIECWSHAPHCVKYSLKSYNHLVKKDHPNITAEETEVQRG